MILFRKVLLVLVVLLTSRYIDVVIAIDERTVVGVVAGERLTKCPINTYSEGGINPTCTPCPNNRPVTKDPGQTSVDSCVPLKCEAGEGVPSGAIFTSGDASQCSGVSKITTAAECKLAAEYNRKNNIPEKNVGYVGIIILVN